jgi:hypothetical protein
MHTRSTQIDPLNHHSFLSRRFIVLASRSLPPLALGMVLIAGVPQRSHADDKSAPFEQARLNGIPANEGLRRCHRYVEGWLGLKDPETGLIPRNRKDRYWNAKDAAADNYPFMVLSTWFTDRPLFEGAMHDMLHTEIRLTSRIGSLPETYDFAKKGFPNAKANLDEILFGSSEYIKDGLLPLTEWLGPSPWRERMISILDDMWENAPVETPFGRIVSNGEELNGEMLQTLSRVYWMTGDRKYLEWAVRLGDFYLLGDHHPTRDIHSLRLRDHGCEVVSGLCELYATASFAMPAKREAYRKPLHEMLDRILEVGRNPDGMLYNVIDPIAGKPIGKGIADTWGYNYNGFYTVHLIDGTEAYRDAVIKVLSSLDRYRNFPWEGQSSDGYADSIESALNLYNREPLASVAAWIDSEIKVMWAKQQPDGVIEGWHGDGNFARTTLMYCLWKSQGLSIHPWREDLQLGAVTEDGRLHISFTAGQAWSGRLLFDAPRHRTSMKLPLDWPRINQFPEWFTADPDKRYTVTINGEAREHTGASMIKGIDLVVKDGKPLNITVNLSR